MRRAVSPALVVALVGCATVAPRGEGPAAQRAPAPPAGAGEAFSESDLPETEAPPPRDARFDRDIEAFDLQARLAVRARSYLGRRGPFRAKGQRFGSDCSGFVEAVYAAEGIMLRDLMQRAAPEEHGGVKAAWYAARQNGRVFGPGEWPAPGDLVFWNDTYDRNRNRRADDGFTHLGVVEYVEDGTVYFLHRGGKGVARGVMTPGRPNEATDADGRKLNSPLRATTHPVKDGGLAGALLAGYGRIDAARLPREYVSREIDPFFGPGADRETPGAAKAETAPTAPPSSAAPSNPDPNTREAATPADSPRSRSATAPTPKRAAGAKSLAARKLVPVRKVPPQKAASKKALARAKSLAAKGRTGPKKATKPASHRAETAAPGGASVPSSPTRSASAPKSSSDSRRSTEITEPAGSR